MIDYRGVCDVLSWLPPLFLNLKYEVCQNVILVFKDIFVFSPSPCQLDRALKPLQTMCQTFCAKHRRETDGETSLLCSVNKLYKFRSGCVISEAGSWGVIIFAGLLGKVKVRLKVLAFKG